jgi:hypothetical protein
MPNTPNVLTVAVKRVHHDSLYKRGSGNYSGEHVRTHSFDRSTSFTFQVVCTDSALLMHVQIRSAY